VRPDEFDAAEKAFETKYPGRIIGSLEDLQLIFNNNPYGEAIINHNWWVQRSQSLPTINLYPPDQYSDPYFLALKSWAVGTPLGIYGTPKDTRRTGAWNNVPFISCKAGSSAARPSKGFVPGKASTNPNDTSPNTAHFYNGTLKGVNAAYADGHVEAHPKKQMTCGYDQGDPYWYY
jgi:prepilin-type processing-associated H-X9-DG protein